jgi:N-acetylneuraminic acid mutarotase
LKTYGHSVAVDGGKVYCCDSFSNTRVLMFDSETGQWTVLRKCPRNLFSIAVVNGLVTAVGGEQSDTATKTLLSLQNGLSQQKWTEQFPPMTYYHNTPAVATTSTSLIVAGGWGPDGKTAAVEVMDTQTLQWSTVASLPFPLSGATATVCGDRLYIGAGGAGDSGWSKSVLVCEVRELLQSQPQQSGSLATRLGLSLSRPVWKEVAELPVVAFSLVTLQGQLLAVGGVHGSGISFNKDTVSEVRQYNATTYSWNVISHMKVKRALVFAAVLPNNTLVVCGGYTPDGLTNSVQVASVNNMRLHTT